MELWAVSGYGGNGAPDILTLDVTEKFQMNVLSSVCQGDAPSFLCTKNETLYAVSERPDGASVTSYTLWNGVLEKQTTIAVPGTGLCHLFPGKKGIFGSCYGSGDFFAVDDALSQVLWHRPPAKGARQSHAHWACELPEKRALLLADLGLDCVLALPKENGLPSGLEREYTQPVGSGPRQPVPLSNGHLAVINELDGMVRVISLETGAVLQEQPASRKEGKNAPGGGFLGPDGTLFVCNRGPNTVSAFCTFRGLEWLGEWPANGDWPRGVGVSGDGRHVLVACQNSGRLSYFLWRNSALYLVNQLPLAGASCAVHVLDL